MAGKEVVKGIQFDGGQALFVRADVGKRAQVKRIIERTLGAWGRLDILHNNAYWSRDAPATELNEKSWDRMLGVTLKSVYLGAKYAVPAMRESGGGASIRVQCTLLPGLPRTMRPRGSASNNTHYGY